jgi:hypothetical protein
MMIYGGSVEKETTFLSDANAQPVKLTFTSAR